VPIRRAGTTRSATTRAAAALTAAVATVLALGTTAPADAASGHRRGPTQVVVDGHGYGHGRGMSQWGAEEAAEQGVGHGDILDFYYPGTAVGRATGSIRVWIRDDLTNDVQVMARKFLTARRVGTATTWRLDRVAPRAKRWRVLPHGDRTSVLEYLTRRWHRYRQVPGTLELGAGGRPVTLVRQGGRTAYRGVLRSVPSSPGNRITVNVLPLDTYLRGVVPAEVIASTWAPQALQAQAVAARSYAVYRRDHRTSSAWDVDNTAVTQAYGGAAAEYRTSDAAVRATAGEIRTYDGAAAFTEFTASNGGWRAAGDAPYLTAQEDLYENPDTPHHDWRARLTTAQIEAKYPSIGDLLGITAADRTGDPRQEWGGRVGTVTVSGTTGAVTRSGAEFAATFGLSSTWFNLTLS
jgi:SpoIID/LytB domain protein